MILIECTGILLFFQTPGMLRWFDIINTMSEFVRDVVLLAGQNQFLAYFIIYLATIFLGNIAAFIGLWIALRGTFGVWGVPLMAADIYASEITGDLLWYSLGSALRDTRFGNFVKN